MQAINLKEKLKLFDKQWHPHLIKEGQNLQVYLSKIQGEFVMHTHEEADEFFYVVRGTMEMCFDKETVEVREGEVILVPAGVRHCPRTRVDEEVHVLVVEPIGTTHTGDVKTDKTVDLFERV